MRMMQILTIGHSNLELELFLERLGRYEAEVLVDIRSAPFSVHCPHFNRPALRIVLRERAIHYSFAGRSLGGKPGAPELCRRDGGPDYDKIAAAPSYRDGIARLAAVARKRRVVVMCAEAEPEGCHRHKLVGRSLCALGIDVRHILPNGSLSAPAQPWLIGAEVEAP